MVAGGGAGQTDAGSGGGAGGVLTNIPGLMPATSAIPAVGTGSPNALTVTIGGGGAGEFGPTNPTPSQPGSDTTMSGPGPIKEQVVVVLLQQTDHHMVVNLVVQVVVVE